jgi:hypothetical protein
VSYDPRTEKTLVPETFEVDPENTMANRYWGAFTTTYPVIIPKGVKVWSVGNRDETGDVDTMKVTALAIGKIIPAARSVVFSSETAAPRFVPTSLASNVSVANTYAKGFYCDSLVADDANGKYVYEFRNGDRGPGFYRTHGQKVIPSGSAYAVYGTASQPGRESYVMGPHFNAVLNKVLGIEQLPSTAPSADAIYSIEGVRLQKEPAHGLYIKGGRKYIK